MPPDQTNTPEPIQPHWHVIIPASGLSRRMGSPKLLLPFRQTTVIGNLLKTLTRPEISSVNVVCRQADFALHEEVRSRNAQVVVPPKDSRDMRSSVEFGLSEIARSFHPTSSDGWILIPADHPLVTPATLDLLFTFWRGVSSPILVPTYQGKRGHPTLFRWDTSALVQQIPTDRGLNWILRESGLPVTEIEIDDPCIVEDLDTPEDYERLRQTHPE